jgi:tRNA dimethylallyltransferase
VKARTRQFARRQETWFRALSECSFVPMQAGVEPARVAEAIVEIATKATSAKLAMK